MSIIHRYDGPAEEIRDREILGRPVEHHHRAVLAGHPLCTRADWTVDLGGSLLFDEAGLARIDSALSAYAGRASTLHLQLAMDEAVFRDYYSLAPDASAGAMPIPIVAGRPGGDGGTEVLTLRLPSYGERMPFPPGLAPARDVGVPGALLMTHHGAFDLLFANQIAIVSDLRARASRSPWTWLKAMTRRSGVRGRAQRVARAYRAVHPTAEVHPTAVVEGAVVGPRARVGAHCVVRYSVIAEDARLHDGAKVELSVVGAGAWLMHDLVLYRSVAERGTFLIHGPYQFSSFHRDSGGFATIMMDYRPDGRPIQVKTAAGLRAYAGPFLGSVVGEGAKTLGGSLVAPGRIVPPQAWLSADPASIHLLETDTLPPQRVSAPGTSRRRTE
jgi:hypothetical protein